MITLSLIKNSGAAAKYYAKEDNYYLAEADAKEASFWYGKGAAELGYDGKVEEKDLQELFAGNLPNGITVGLHKDSSKKHRAGYDICFHAPKSVSILALDGGDKRFHDAHLAAVKETLTVIEKDCAQVKVVKDGKVIFENTKNLTVALVRHTASREHDPHLHHHALVMNITQKQDGSWRALASNTMKSGEIQGFSERVYNRQIYYGAIYKNSLANKVVQLGCEIEPVGKHGMWEIKGVPQEALDIMSKRRKKIEEQIEKLHYSSLKAADIASLDTRKNKQKNLSMAEIKQTWKEELATVGFSSQEFIAKLDQVKVREDIGKNNLAEATYAIKDAVLHLSQYNLKLDYAKIIALGLEFTIGKATHSDMVQALEVAIKNGELIPVNKTNSLFVTKDLIATEKTIMDLAEQSKKVSAAIYLKSKTLAGIPDGVTKDLAIDILESSSRLNIIEHKDADNVEFTSTVLNLAESSGKTVRVLSPNRMLANDINENIKRKPNNLWQWLVSLGKPEIGECVAGFKHKYREEVDLPLLHLRQGNDVLVINSAETLACDDLKTLLELTEKTQAKVIFLHDTSMKQGFTAGNAMETLKHAGVDILQVKKEAKVLSYVPEITAISDDAKRIKQLACAYVLQENSSVIVGAKDQIKPTTEAIREELKNQGKLSRMEYNISVLNPVYLSKPESAYANKYQKNIVLRFYDAERKYQDWQVVSINKEKNLVELIQDKQIKLWNPKQQPENIAIFKVEELQLAVGDKLIATSNMRELGIKNATKFTTQEINKDAVTLLSNGRVTKINLNDLQNSHLQHDYVTTISRSSKKPANHILADIKAYSLDKAMLNELTSRAKDSLTIFTNDANLAAKKLEHISIKLTAIDTVINFADNKVDRFINNKTIPEIKNDIEKAIASIANRNELAAKAERQAVNFAIEKLTSRNAGFEHKDLVTAALEYALKEIIAPDKIVTHEAIEKIISEKHQSGELVMGKHFSDGTRWTTKEILDLERSIIQDIKKGQNKLPAFLSSQVARELLEPTKLTQDQKNACHLITTTKDQFVIVQGYAGTGKTSMFAQVKAMLKDQEILGLAPTHKAVKELKDKGIQAQTLKSFLVENKPVTNKLVILDEASMVPNADFAQFLALVGNNHIVLSGDRDQHLSPGSGKIFDVVQKANILKIAYLREIVRQKNPNLKKAVEHIINKDYASALELIAKENPQEHIERNKHEFFDALKLSVVEIDNNKLGETNKNTLEYMLAEDFLSRTPQAQDNTVVIAHAHEDRRIITGFIRAGLKEQGKISEKGIMVNCLISKQLTKADYKSMRSYNLDDVVKWGREYYQVIENDQSSKSLLLKDEVGKFKHFYPQKDVDKYNIELYKNITAELAVGDLIRLTKTDKERELYANFEYKVTEVNNDQVTLASREGVENKNITLSTKELKNAHWDYAQTVTGYGIQGGSRKFVIDFEVSYRKELANQRSFYIGSSRAIEHVTTYTDNKAKLLGRIGRNTGDKYSALEIAGELESKKIQEHANKTAKILTTYYDTQKTVSLLNEFAEVFVARLLGRPNEKLSSATQWRYGKKGSLVISIAGEKKGYWHNFETGESGNLLNLIQKETGLSFQDALKYAAGTLDRAPLITGNIQAKLAINAPKPKEKTSEYAQQLVAESLPIANTIVEKYLKETRGINNINTQDIRYHPKVFVSKNTEEKNLPAMLSLARDKDGKVQCVQATYLDIKTADKANVATKKRTYSSPSGALVALQNHNKSTLSFIAEGVETGLSIKDAVKDNDVFVTLGKSNFKTINPEMLSKKVIFCLDNDGATTATDEVIHKSVQRLIEHGKEVFVAIPAQINNRKTDFNDTAKHAGVEAVRANLDKAMPYKTWKDNSIAGQNILNKFDDIKVSFMEKIKQKEDKINYNIYSNITNNTKNSVAKMPTINMQKTQQVLARNEREIY